MCLQLDPSRTDDDPVSSHTSRTALWQCSAPRCGHWHRHLSSGSGAQLPAQLTAASHEGPVRYSVGLRIGSMSRCHAACTTAQPAYTLPTGHPRNVPSNCQESTAARIIVPSRDHSYTNYLHIEDTVPARRTSPCNAASAVLTLALLVVDGCCLRGGVARTAPCRSSPTRASDAVARAGVMTSHLPPNAPPSSRQRTRGISIGAPRSAASLTEAPRLPPRFNESARTPMA